ncbi:hypothetical protein DFJ73DRAFT_859247, partial [Zopfochytrium polystomum]
MILLLCFLASSPLHASFALANPNPGNTQSSGGGPPEVTVGTETVAIHNELAEGANGVAYLATDSHNKEVIYKENKHEDFSSNEVTATARAGQYISHDGKKMVQKKVGDMDLSEYLKSDKAKQLKLASGEKLSEKIMSQIKDQEKNVGFRHF